MQTRSTHVPESHIFESYNVHVQQNSCMFVLPGGPLCKGTQSIVVICVILYEASKRETVSVDFGLLSNQYVCPKSQYWGEN